MSRAPAPAVVLMYHRVAAPDRDTHDLCVAPDRFAEQVAHLRRREEVVPLRDVRRPSRRRRVVITFDDGYADNALVAREVLEAEAACATFFITVGLLGSRREQWWDELELLLLDAEPRARHIEVEVGDGRVLLDVGSQEARQRAHSALYDRLRPLPRPVVERVLDDVRAQVDAPDGVRESHRFMTADELRSVATSDVVEIGGHAVSHQQLSQLSEDDQRREIVDGRRRLQELTGREVATMAYPFGGREAFDATSERLAREAGYRIACAGWPGVVQPWTPRFRVPRFVVKDWPAAELADRLEAWFRHR